MPSSPGQKASMIERRRRIRRALQEVPIQDVSVESLADQFDVSVTTIYRDLEALKEEIPKEDAENIVVNILGGLANAERTLRQLLKSTNENVRLGAAKQYVRTLESHIGFLERTGHVTPKGLGSAAQPIVVLEGVDLSDYPAPLPPGDRDDEEDEDED